MKRSISLCAALFITARLFADDATPKDTVTAAAKQLAAQDNYSWKATIDLGPNAPYTPGPTEGKVQKDGLAWLSSTFRDNTVVGVVQGGKVAVKTEDGWQTGEEARNSGGGGFNPAMFMARRLQNFKAPAADAADLLSKTKDMKQEGDMYSGDLTEAGAKDLLTMGFRRPGSQAAATNAQGSVKFWLKDGALTKYQTKVTGRTQNWNGEDMDVDRTVTIEIKDVGATKIDLPEEARKKLS